VVLVVFRGGFGGFCNGLLVGCACFFFFFFQLDIKAIYE